MPFAGRTDENHYGISATQPLAFEPVIPVLLVLVQVAFEYPSHP
jgi:hypothetical protein